VFIDMHHAACITEALGPFQQIMSLNHNLYHTRNHKIMKGFDIVKTFCIKKFLLQTGSGFDMEPFGCVR